MRFVRARLVIAAASALMAALVAIAWIASEFRYVEWRSQRPDMRHVLITKGTLTARWADESRAPLLGGIPLVGSIFRSPPPLEFGATTSDHGRRWGVDFESDSWLRHLTVPAWAPLTVLAAAAWLMWWPVRRGRRFALADACGKCGYALAGLGADVPCPECGAPQLRRSRTPRTRPTGRGRRHAMVIIGVACVVLCVTWVCSEIWYIETRLFAPTKVSLSRGVLTVSMDDPALVPRFTLDTPFGGEPEFPPLPMVAFYRNHLERPSFWRMGWEKVFWSDEFAAPLWIPLAVVTLVAGVLAWQARGRFSLDACAECEYSRVGLRPDAARPECGQPRT